MLADQNQLIIDNQTLSSLNWNLIGLPWHACAPVGKGDWSLVGPGKRLVGMVHCEFNNEQSS